ncbi:FAD binding domain protein [Apiospora sp. TS-2023a]
MFEPYQQTPEEQRKEPRVVIVGGGTTGLALALMLERFEIDYVLFEGHEEIAPHQGAGLALWANAYRILDQLGLYDQFAATSTPLERMGDWWSDGTPSAASEDFSSVVKQVFGYPLIIMDRQQAVRNIYDKIRDKSKIHAGKKVVAVDLSDEQVSIKLDTGEIVTGDLLVGADGVHSVVRSEMWRLGNERLPGCFNSEGPDSITCNWAGLFGIADLKDLKLQPGAAITAGKDRTTAYMTGKGRAYFVYNHKLPKELRSGEIRRFTEAERDQYVEERRNDMIQNHIKFSDLYRNRIRSAAYVPLQRYALHHWHFGRIVLLGDTAHKPHPVTGQGAAMCLEDAATFVNLLTANLSTGSHLDSEQVEQMFRELERLRVPRTTAIVNESFLAQSMQSWQNPLLKIAYMYILPRLGLDFTLAQAMNTNCPAPRLEGLPMPDRPALVGFNDRNPEPQNPMRLLFKWAAFAILLVSALTTGIFGQKAVTNLAEHTVEWDRISGVIVVILVEGWRRNNTMSLLQWPVVWTVLGDFLLGWQRTIPLFLLATFFSHSRNGRLQYTAPARPMVLTAVRVLPVAFFLANYIPRIAARLGHPFWDPLQPLATLGAMLVTICSCLWAGRGIPPVETGIGRDRRVSAFFEHRIGYLYGFYSFALGNLAILLFDVRSGLQPWSSVILPSLMRRYLADLAFLVGTVSEVCFYSGMGPWSLAYVAMVPVSFVCLGPGPTLWYSV